MKRIEFSAIFLALLLALTGLPASAHATPFVVNTDFDNANAHDLNPGDGACNNGLGFCPLRAAIEETNALNGADTITFDPVFFGAPKTIAVDPSVGDLPPITDELMIDAGSVWNSGTDTPGVTLDGADNDMYGLSVQADYCQIYGLFITRFKEEGVRITSSHNTVGQTSTSHRNVLSGNGDGIALRGSGANGNFIVNNYIGITPQGTAKLPNDYGVNITGGASLNTIGGASAAFGNMISGNIEMGVSITGSGTDTNKLGGNTIGGSTALGNGIGVYVSDASNTVIGDLFGGLARNTISGNGAAGIDLVLTSGTYISGNEIHENGDSGVGIWEAQGTVLFNNIIHHNSNNGVLIAKPLATGNRLNQNSIYDNLLMGIDLSQGANNGITAPLVTAAAASGASGTACSSCTVEIFSDSVDEGKTYEGTVAADSAGNWTYGGAISGPNVTATATDGADNSSAFSTPRTLFSWPKFLPAITGASGTK